jgi:YidC/Oxa1 family membrane protein insertase
MDIQRLILFVVFAFSVMLLWQRWEEGHQPPPQALRSAPAGDWERALLGLHRRAASRAPTAAAAASRV